MQGCRCTLCREANRLAHHARERHKRAVVAHLPLAPGRRCPGIHGERCRWRTKLRADSTGICHRCRDKVAFNGFVDATFVRQHLRQLLKDGIGLRAVEAASDVSRSALTKLRSGVVTKLRQARATRILAVDASCIADAALVPAGPTRRRLRTLIEEGYPRARLAQLLGLKVPALPLLYTKQTQVEAITARRVERLYRQLRGEA